MYDIYIQRAVSYPNSQSWPKVFGLVNLFRSMLMHMSYANNVQRSTLGMWPEIHTIILALRGMARNTVVDVELYIGHLIINNICSIRVC